jgi:hypothetical protein
MENQQSTEVTPSQDPAAAQAQTHQADLIGVIGQNQSYLVCIVNKSEINEDGTFTTDKAITYSDTKSAITALQTLLDHAKAADLQNSLAAAYQEGLQTGLGQVAAESKYQPTHIRDVLVSEPQNGTPPDSCGEVVLPDPQI